VIVNDLNVIRVPIVPAEAEPPLVVDANAMLALAASFQGFETIAGRAVHVTQDFGAVQLAQLPLRNPFNGTETRHSFAPVKALRLFTAKRSDHMFKV
jgi:hypothetical protein